MNWLSIIISLLSGTFGVLVGVLIQLYYTKKSDKEKLVHEYKKFCVIDWVNLNNEVQKLVDDPKPHNNTIFNQSLTLKGELLSFIPTIEEKYKDNIKNLQDQINKTRIKLSLELEGEEALNDKNCDKDKKARFIRNVNTLSSDTIKAIIKLSHSKNKTK